jgi:hypothetical protein
MVASAQVPCRWCESAILRRRRLLVVVVVVEVAVEVGFKLVALVVHYHDDYWLLLSR